MCNEHVFVCNVFVCNVFVCNVFVCNVFVCNVFSFAYEYDGWDEDACVCMRITCALDVCLCVMCAHLRMCTMNRMRMYVHDLCGEYVCV